MKVYYVLYNPYAGNGAFRNHAEKLCGAFTGDYKLVDITSITDYEAFFASLPEEAQIVISGGDGTLNRFLNQTRRLSLPEALYYCACGSGNDFQRDITGKDTAQLIPLTPYIRDLPMVTVNGKEYLFLNGVGFGIDGYCCEVGDKLRKESDKPINYAMIAIKGLLFHFKPRSASVTVDGKEYSFRRVWLAPTMNGRFYGGGMMPTPDQDRLAEPPSVSTMVMHSAGKLRALAVFPSIFKGEHVKHTKMVTVLKGRDITVTFDRPTALQIDGETVSGVTSCRMRAAVREASSVGI